MRSSMNLFVSLMLWLLSSCFAINNYKSMNLKYGFYYGRNKGFFPQSIVYVEISESEAIVECYLPLKGVFFLTLTDTLSFVNEENSLYLSEQSMIYSKKGEIFFETIKGQCEFNVEKTLITYQPDKESENKEIRSKAKPFKD